MGNYGAILVIGVLMISIFPFFLNYIDTQTSLQQDLKTVIARDIINEKEKLYSSIEINRTSISWIDNTTFEMSILNNGKESIFLRDFRYITIVVTYYTNGVKRSAFIPYNQSGTKGNTDFWVVVSAYDVDIGREILNPVNLSDSPSGAWDPNEVLKIRIYLSTRYPRDSLTEYLIVFTLPNGCSDVAVGDQP
jgi:hypothetical protein